MRPVDQSAQVVPFVHATYLHPVTHPQWNALREVDVVSDQQCPAGTDVDDKALVRRAIIVVRQKPPDEACNFDPAAVISLGIHPGDSILL